MLHPERVKNGERRCRERLWKEMGTCVSRDPLVYIQQVVGPVRR